MTERGGFNEKSHVARRGGRLRSSRYRSGLGAGQAVRRAGKPARHDQHPGTIAGGQYGTPDHGCRRHRLSPILCRCAAHQARLDRDQRFDLVRRSRPLSRPERRRGDPAAARRADQPRGGFAQRDGQPARPARHLRPHHAQWRGLCRPDPVQRNQHRLDPARRVQFRRLLRDHHHQVARCLGSRRRPVGQYRSAHRPRAGPQAGRLPEAVR